MASPKVFNPRPYQCVERLSVGTPEFLDLAKQVQERGIVDDRGRPCSLGLSAQDVREARREFGTGDACRDEFEIDPVVRSTVCSSAMSPEKAFRAIADHYLNFRDNDKLLNKLKVARETRGGAGPLPGERSRASARMILDPQIKAALAVEGALSSEGLQNLISTWEEVLSKFSRLSGLPKFENFPLLYKSLVAQKRAIASPAEAAPIDYSKSRLLSEKIGGKMDCSVSVLLYLTATYQWNMPNLQVHWFLAESGHVALFNPATKMYCDRDQLRLDPAFRQASPVILSTPEEVESLLTYQVALSHRDTGDYQRAYDLLATLPPTFTDNDRIKNGQDGLASVYYTIYERLIELGNYELARKYCQLGLDLSPDEARTMNLTNAMRHIDQMTEDKDA